MSSEVKFTPHLYIFLFVLKFWKRNVGNHVGNCADRQTDRQTDMTGLEAAEMRFLRSVTVYTRLDKIRSEVIRKELQTYGI